MHLDVEEAVRIPCLEKRGWYASWCGRNNSSWYTL